MLEQKSAIHTNALIDSTSPYLLQHAHNPVNWFPWGEEVLRLAKEGDKPIFLSIGYSACHWCHVMERESFENEDIAAIMNEHFVNIKVDREEHPDLDEIYMSAVQAMIGQGGWPLSVFLTPDLKPFYGGAYFPPHDQYGRPGFSNLLLSVANAFKESRNEIQQSADLIARHIQERMRVVSGESPLDGALIERCIEEMRRRFDGNYGGFGEAPKFPHSMDISLLLRWAQKTGDRRALEMAEFSLQKMALGGMYDQLGGGFHRYSTDAQWLIPHFEKMLYDNALLARTYTEAYQLTHNEFDKCIAVDTLNYVLREMTSPEGGFYSSQDADSENREGTFFIWTPEQIAKHVGDANAPMVCRYFGVERDGNFENGASVLHRPIDDETAARLLDLSVEKWKILVEDARNNLYAARDLRPKPNRDEKILTDWNGLAISALAFAGAAFGEERFIHAAERACRFLLSVMQNDKPLQHACMNRRAHIDGFLSDYAFLIYGLLDTYEASADPVWLEEALKLAHSMIAKFWDHTDGAFFFAADDGENRIARSKNPMDNAIPSGNSIAIYDLLRLAEITDDASFREKAMRSLRVFSDSMASYPSAFTQMLAALDFHLNAPKIIVVAGDSRESLISMKRAIFSEFLPNKVVLYRYPEDADRLESLAPCVKGKSPIQNRTTTYVCENYSCSSPIVSPEGFVERIRLRSA